MLTSMMLRLPFELWSTFKVEAEFGFNKTTLGTFIADKLKALLLGALLGLPLLALVLWLFESTRWAALWAWLAVGLFGLLMTWIAPRFLMPLFLKFTPMEDGPLRRAIMALAEKLSFPVAGIFTVDGSRRSTKANAFFAGFGRTRRIALFDTLLEGHTQEEIVAVLAHEIGHAKLGHVPRMIAADLAQSALMFGLLHIALHDTRLFAAFGVAYPSVGIGLVLFSMIYGAWSHLIDPLFQALSRKHEFEADAFARESMGSAGPLASALKKLSKEHLAHLTPHPLYVWLHHSHPPVGQRLAALAGKLV
jgi:STE24 endopeptidase